MKKAVQLIRNYPFSITCYILYALFCYLTITFILSFNATFDHIKSDDPAWGGQGVLFGNIFTFVIAIIFLIVTILNALFRKNGGRAFYWWMCLFIIIPLFIIIAVD